MASALSTHAEGTVPGRSYVGFGVVGVGRRMSSLLDELMLNPEGRYRIVAVADSAEAPMKTASEIYGCPGFSTIEEMLQAHGDVIDWILVCSICITCHAPQSLLGWKQE